MYKRNRLSAEAGERTVFEGETPVVEDPVREVSADQAELTLAPGETAVFTVPGRSRGLSDSASADSNSTP